MSRLRCGDRVFAPVVHAKGASFEVTLGGRSFSLALEPLADGVFLVREGGRACVLHVARDGAAVHAFWDGVAYVLEEEREGARAAHRHDAGGLEAPMPGRVAAVHVAAGQRVTRGQELLVVEAMKMENALRAPKAGVVRSVAVKVGDMVAPGRVLVEIE